MDDAVLLLQWQWRCNYLRSHRRTYNEKLDRPSKCTPPPPNELRSPSSTLQKATEFHFSHISNIEKYRIYHKTSLLQPNLTTFNYKENLQLLHFNYFAPPTPFTSTSHVLLAHARCLSAALGYHQHPSIHRMFNRHQL